MSTHGAADQSTMWSLIFCVLQFNYNVNSNEFLIYSAWNVFCFPRNKSANLFFTRSVKPEANKSLNIGSSSFSLFFLKTLIGNYAQRVNKTFPPHMRL